MYNNPYLNNTYSPQVSIDRINNQIAELEKMRTQLQQPVQQPQPTNLTQNFQLAPTNREVIRYANSIDEVQRDMVMGDTPYFSKDMSIVWIKNTKNEIKTYELIEIIPKDEKDLTIEYLQQQIEELKKGMIVNEPSSANDDKQYVEANTTENDGAIGTTTKANKSTSVSRVSNSKKK